MCRPPCSALLPKQLLLPMAAAAPTAMSDEVGLARRGEHLHAAAPTAMAEEVGLAPVASSAGATLGVISEDIRLLHARLHARLQARLQARSSPCRMAWAACKKARWRFRALVEEEVEVWPS